MTSTGDTLELGNVKLTLPEGWSVPKSADLTASVPTVIAVDINPRDSPSMVAMAFMADDPEPPDAPLALLVAGLFLDVDCDYEPLGNITSIEVDGFDDAYRADGVLTLMQLGDRELVSPTRYHLMQAILAGPVDQRTHLQVAQPADRHEPALDDEMLIRLRPTPMA